MASTPPDVKPSKAPTPKVTAAGAAGSLVVVLVWVAGLYGLDVPPLVAAAAAVVLSFAAAYAVRDR